jgi:hypothetical protein
MKNRRLALLLLPSALTLGACGGGDGKPTRDEFVAKADKLCAATNEQGTQLARESFADPRKPTAEEAQAFVRRAVPLQRRLLRDVGDLERPDGDDARIDRLLASAGKGTDAIERAGATPKSALALLNSPEDPLAESQKLAKDYGLEDCAG